jgi:hypothetical protein
MAPNSAACAWLGDKYRNNGRGGSGQRAEKSWSFNSLDPERGNACQLPENLKAVSKPPQKGDRHNLLRGLRTTIAAMVPGQSPAVLKLLLVAHDRRFWGCHALGAKRRGHAHATREHGTPIFDCH